MHPSQPDQIENEFRNIKLKLKGPNRHSELQAVKALMAMSAQQTFYSPLRFEHFTSKPSLKSYSSQDQVINYSGRSAERTDLSGTPPSDSCSEESINESRKRRKGDSKGGQDKSAGRAGTKPAARTESRNKDRPMDLSRSESPEPIYGLAITMTEEEFKELAEREGIEDVIGEPICRLCGGLFSGPLGIALHMCPAMKRQTYRCELCGEDKWKTKANLHSHIKWCKKRLGAKTEQHESKQVYQ